MEETMKRTRLRHSILISSVILICLPSLMLAQRGGPRASPNAAVTQRLGTNTDITITYSRPGVKGRTIWGKLVPYDKVWRAGANKNTTIEFNTDLVIEGETLPAGKYGLWMKPTKQECVVIFNGTNDVWGTNFKAETVTLEVTVKTEQAPQKEWLAYGFEDLTGTSATAYLHWEALKIPFKIQLAN